MNNTELYQELFSQLDAADIFSPDFPAENAETTLNMLWRHVQGSPCSPVQACSIELSPLPENKVSEIRSLVEKRIQGVPLAYLTGKVNFMGYELLASKDVLIPRPETELLGSTVVERLLNEHSSKKEFTGIDIGCGSGNLSCAIASVLSKCIMYACDVTTSCVELTRKNIALLNLENRVTVFQGDLFSPIANKGLEGTVDFIVSNPPYIPSAKLQTDLAHLTHHEPEAAFNGGAYGFSLHHRLIKESILYLKPGGMLAFEFGTGQEKQVQALFNRVKGYELPIHLISDKKGNPRVAVAYKK